VRRVVVLYFRIMTDTNMAVVLFAKSQQHKNSRDSSVTIVNKLRCLDSELRQRGVLASLRSDDAKPRDADVV